MPNWIEGTMKLRGKRKDIERFFREGVETNADHNWEDISAQVTIEVNDDVIEINFNDKPYISDTRQAFITSDYLYLRGKEDDEVTICVNVKQAWNFCAREDGRDCEWDGIAKKYDVDIKLFGIECGMEFTQEVIILRGRRPVVNDKKYENWEWDCPFPNMGG